MFARDCMSRLLAVTLFLASAGCAGPDPREKLFIQTRHDSEVDFGAYATYAWAPNDRAWASPVFTEYPALPGMIGSAVDARLTTMGFEKTSAQAADFLVAVSANAQEVTVISKRRYRSWAHSYDRALPTNVNTATQLDRMPQDTLVLEIIDTASEGVVWHAQAAGVITGGVDMDKAVDDAVGRMLALFPPES
jgi:hypothetical protein